MMCGKDTNPAAKRKIIFKKSLVTPALQVMLAPPNENLGTLADAGDVNRV
jgi:hypothetical protein